MRLSGPRGLAAIPAAIVVVMTLSCAAGCGSVSLSLDARRQISSVSVKEVVVDSAKFSGSCPDMELPTRSAVWYSFWVTSPIGAVIDLIDWPRNSRRRIALFERKLGQASVDVPAMTQASFVSGLGRAGVFPAVFPPVVDADAEFELSLEHGLTDHMGLSEAWHPWVSVHGVLKRRSTGEVLWRQTAKVGSSDERVPAVQYPFRRHDRLRHAYQKAIDAAISVLVQSLQSA